MPLVLCTGANTSLMKTRQLILENAGHTVVPAYNSQELEKICSEHKFDVAVIGQSTPASLKREHMAVIRKSCPTSKVLELFAPYVGRVLDDADAWLEMPPETPQRFVETVNMLASRSSAPTI
jgi:CheY-like chemotaxis protein